MLAACLLMGNSAFALAPSEAEVAISLGLHSSSVQSDVAGVSISSKNSAQFGALFLVPMSEPLYFRTGMLYTQRYFTATVSNQDTNYNFTYLDFPITAMYKFSENGGLFAGVLLSLNQSKTCDGPSGSNCSVSGVQQTLVPITVGGTMKFAENFGGDISYSFHSGKVADNVSNLQTIGVNLLIFF